MKEEEKKMGEKKGKEETSMTSQDYDVIWGL